MYEDLSIPLLVPGLARLSGMWTRTRFIDRRMIEAFDRGVAQVVVIGAGYDCRALRFSEAPVRWFEVDHPSTQQDKLRRLARTGAPTGHISFVSLDLTEGDLSAELEAAGHDPDSSTLWLCEGLFSYLSREAILRLCETLRSRSTADSALVCNVLVRGSGRRLSRLVRAGVDGVLAAVGERRMAEFAPGDLEGLLADAGWCISEKELTTPARSDETYLVAISAFPKPPVP